MKLKEGSSLQNGKYQIEGILGQGGFGITYLATQKITVSGEIGKIDTKIKVAIKEFFMKEHCNRDQASSYVSIPLVGSKEVVDGFRAKFVKEAINISKLQHKNIVKVLDIFEENGTGYYVMEYIEGGSLADQVASCGKLSEDEALHYILQLADALGYIHKQHINHLDVKPSNTLIREGAQIAIIDFGLSKRYDVQGNATSSTPVGVSKGYAPIEQYKKGGVSEFSPATDIYSLGATLYKLVTGETPPDAGDILDEGFPELPADVSLNIQSAIKAAMSPRRKDRPQTIAEFLEIIGSTDLESTVVNVFDAADDGSTMLIEKKVAPKRVETPKPQKVEAKPQKVEVKPKEVKPKEAATTKSAGTTTIIIISAIAVVIVAVVLIFTLQGKSTSVPVEEVQQDVTEMTPDELCTLGLSYIDNEDEANYDLAFEYLQKAAYEGNADAQNNLGYCYDNAIGVALDEQEAASWYYTAAENGSLLGMCNIGLCYELGTGVNIDYTEAVAWYRKAAKEGFAMGQYLYGCAFAEGIGVKIDNYEAERWITRAADQGYEPARKYYQEN